MMRITTYRTKILMEVTAIMQDLYYQLISNLQVICNIVLIRYITTVLLLL